MFLHRTPLQLEEVLQPVIFEEKVVFDDVTRDVVQSLLQFEYEPLAGMLKCGYSIMVYHSIDCLCISWGIVGAHRTA